MIGWGGNDFRWTVTPGPVRSGVTPGTVLSGVIPSPKTTPLHTPAHSLNLHPPKNIRLSSHYVYGLLDPIYLQIFGICLNFSVYSELKVLGYTFF